ncbi:MAG: hypothetical protein MJ196_07055 [Treponemataceae bacterium]|nr:hypothetical protein [Treponemataceae bacterium]
MSRIIWRLADVVENAHKMVALCAQSGVNLSLVTKFCLSQPELIVPVLKTAGINSICDSNCQNFLLLNAPFPVHKSLIKTTTKAIQSFPQLSRNSRPDRLFVSDKGMLDEFYILPKEMRPEVVLIAECGDLKDGFSEEQIIAAAESYPDLNIIGISANFSALSGHLPTFEAVQKLAILSRKVSSIRRNMPFLSIGGTAVYDLLQTGMLIGLVQEVRIGEGIFFGYNSSKRCPIPDFSQNTVLFQGEIIEIAEKRVENIPPDGFNSLGTSFEESVLTGNRKRAVLDFGTLAANQNDLIPNDNGTVTVGQTSDFTVLDITSSAQHYRTGNYVTFLANYASASQAMLNPFVEKIVQ